MHTSKIGRKRKLAALLAAFAVVVGGAFSPLTPTAMADTTTANTLAELKAQINGASGARTITLGNDIAWDGQSIVIPAGKDITLYGDHTIFRDKNATTLNPMFDVKGTLTLGGKVKLSGKTGSCSAPQTTTPKVSGPFGGEIPEIEDDEFWEEWPADQKFAPFRGKDQRVMIGFPDMERDSGPDDDPGVAHLSGDGGLIMAAEENVFKDVTEWLYPGREDEVVGHNPDGTPIRGYRVKRAYLQEGVDLNEYVFTIVDIMDDEWQAGYFKTSDGKYLGRPGSGNLTPVRIVEKNAAGYLPIETQANRDLIGLKFQISGTNWAVEKFLVPDKQGGNSVVVQALAGAQTYTRGRPASHLWIETKVWYVEGAKNSDGSKKAFTSLADAQQWAQDHTSPRYWTVEGTDEHFPTQTQAQDWADDHATTTPGSCTIDNTCSKITTAMFNGSKGNEKGFFVQVSGNGVFNLQGNAELSNFLTGPNVSYVAPVVAKGGTVNIKGGKIHDNSAGYNADDSKNQQGAKQIQTYIEKNLAHTETAGAVMYLGGAKGAITGGTIENNRGDTGGILVEGEGTSVTMDGGAINKNVGIHYGGAAYVHFGGSLVMAGNATMNNNYAWDRGGAVYVSSQDYETSIKWPVIDPKEYKPATFVMDGNAVMSGNYAVNRAGAIFVESHDVMLKSGQITGNFSRSLGGAIYVVGDGDKRMYQLYVPNACVTGNTAVKGGVNAGPLNKALPNSTGDTCTVNNNLQSTNSPLQGDNVDFKNHEGFGGGVWLCAFGGNATFGSGQDAQGNNANVVVAGNNAQPQQGADMHLRPTKPGAGSGINVLNNYSDDHWVNEKNNKPIVVNQVYTGPLNVKNSGSAQCSGSLKIQGNYARVGGGIASDGTVIFGPAKDIYRVHGKLDVTKTWENVPEKDRKPIELQLAVKEGNTTYPLEGYKVRLDGTADVFDNENELQDNDGKYNNETPAWEATPWNGTFGLPLVYTDSAGTTKPIFTFKDPDNASRTLNPAEPEDLPRLYELIKAKRLSTGSLTASLAIIETVNGQAPTEYVYSEEDVTLNVNSSATDSKTLAQKTYKDRAGNVIGTVKTNKLALNMHKDITNKPKEEIPNPEKYVNKDVHQDIINFDQEFTYDVMAYVPKDATSVTIRDTLIEGLEFADANGNPTTDGRRTVQRIAYRATNDHTPNGSVAADPEGMLTKDNQTIGISGDTLTVTIDKATPLNRIKGKWVQITFKARIKDNYRSLDSDGNPKGLTKLPGWKTIPNNQNAPVVSNQPHTGMSNAAKYIVAPAHDGVTEYDTNTVTIKPETEQVKVEKRWNVNGSTAWPDGIQNVTFGVFESANGTKVREVTLTKNQPTATVTDLPKLKGVTYSAKEIKVNGVEVSGANDASSTTGAVKVSDLLKFIAKTIKDADTYVTLNEAPEVEKYVNNNVHAELQGFDEVFEYSVMAYVPKGATKVEITDTLSDDLLFVDLNGKVQGETGFDATKLITNSSRFSYDLVIEDSNDHTVGGTVANHSNRGFYSNHAERHLNGPIGRADGVALSNGGKTITVTVNENELNANGKQVDAHGKWIVLSFRATINPDSYADVKTQLKAGADPAVAGLSWQKITQDTPVLGGQTPHAGLDNKAAYTVHVDNGGKATHETNTVTVKPGITSVTATKKWLNEQGESLPWPDEVPSVTIKVTRSDTGAEVGTITLTKDKQTDTLEDLPLLEGVTYEVAEEAITTTNGDAYAEYGSVTGTGAENDPYVFTNQKKGGPQIEKYINNGVHENLDAGFDTSFKYDIIAYVPENADSLEINDTLVNALEFAKAPADGKLSNQQTAAAVAYNPDEDSVSDVVTSIVVKDSNNHTVRGTVASTDGADVSGKAEVEINGKDLKVTFGSEDNPITDADNLRGKYIQITFWAKYTPEMIEAAQVGNSKTINGNGAVLGGMRSHTGTVNDATYKVEVGNTWTSDYKSNTVTVKGKDTQLEAAKQWQNADGTPANWPSGVNEVAINVIKNGVKTDIADTITLTANSAIKKSKKLPVLVGVTYSLDEVEVPGYITTPNGNTFINKDIGTPQIEKYINKDVDAHLVEFDKVIEYDIMAFVPHNATAIIITDPLVESLEFSDATGHATLDKNAVVKSVVAKQTNDHKAKGTVSATNGTAVNNAAISFADEGKRLNVEIADATAYQGKWIQVTFYAKYTDDAIRNATTTPVPDNRDVDDNGSVISSIKKHDGTENTASYTLKIGNASEYGSPYDSNTVTHDAETVTVEAEKQWKHADGSDAEWPRGVANVKVNVLKVTEGSASTEVVDTITLTAAKPKVTSDKALPKLIGVTYKLDESTTVPGYTSTVNGAVVVNKAKTYPVEFSKREFGKTAELEGAKIKVTDADGAVVDEWTSSADSSHVMQLEAGEYTFQEVNAPAGYDKITTTVKFKVDTDGKVTVISATENIGGKVSVIDTNHLILEDMPTKHSVTVSKTEFGKANGGNTPELPGATIKVTGPDGFEETWTSTNIPHELSLQFGEYEFVEVNAPKGYDAITTVVKFTVDKDGKVTITGASEDINGKVTVVNTNHLILEDKPKLKPTIEKYVDQDVHSDIVNFDQEFTYDVMVLVTRDATSVQIYDELVNQLDFIDAAGNVSDVGSDVVLSVVAKETNNHSAKSVTEDADGNPVTGSVTETGAEVTNYSAEITGNKLTVTIDDATDVRGKWVQVTFKARIKENLRTLDSLMKFTINDDTPVVSALDLSSGNKAGNHTGVPNTASYMEFDGEGYALEYFVDDEGNDKPEKSNIVTVIPETVKVTIEKQWLNADGWAQASPAQWPAGATVTVNVKNGDDVVRTVILDKNNQSVEITDLPKLIGVTYTVEEVALDNVFALEGEEKVFEVEDGKTVKLVNRLLPRKSEMAIEVAKVDEAGNPLSGAKLKVTGVDLDGNPVDLGPDAEWTTDGTNHLLPHIVPGTYTLTETEAPARYGIADPITFKVTEEGIVTVNGKPLDVPVITMVDKIKPPVETESASPGKTTPPVTTRPLVRTGSPTGIAMIAAFALMGAGAGVLILRRRRS